MRRGKSIIRAAAPLTALLVIAAGARLLPSVFGKEDTTDEANQIPASSQKKPSVKGKHGKPTPPAAPKLADARTQAALQKVVSGQLSAFAQDDFAQALRYSAPWFRQSHTPDTFREMVKTGYAGLLAYKTLRFDRARLMPDAALMPVFLKSEKGGEAGYMYVLRREATPGTGLIDPKKAEAGTPKPAAPKAGANEAAWYIEGVSPLTTGGYPLTRPGSGSITDIREI